jgi:HK97 family phage prohead protease
MKVQLEQRILTIQELETRKTHDGKKIIGGYAAKFEVLSEDLGGFREKIRRGAFSKSLGERGVLAFWNHNSDIVLGNTLNNTMKVWEDEIGLRFELEMPDTNSGEDAYKTIDRGDAKGVSFGFRTEIDEWDESNRNDIIRTLIEVKLYEVSPTSMPAYPQTNVSARSLEEHQKEVDMRTEQIQRAGKLRISKIRMMELEVK